MIVEMLYSRSLKLIRVLPLDLSMISHLGNSSYPIMVSLSSSDSLKACVPLHLSTITATTLYLHM